jgi:hypothetical protein
VEGRRHGSLVSDGGTHGRRRERPRRPRTARELRPILLEELADTVADLTRHAADSESRAIRRLQGRIVELERLTAKLQAIEIADEADIRELQRDLRRYRRWAGLLAVALGTSLAIMLLTGLWSLTTLMILLGVLGAVPGMELLSRLPTKR